MAQNEKLRTEDIIEILDGKILTTEGHPALGVLPRETYGSVLEKIAEQVLTPDQKLAFDSTLTTPSALNPVVLKDDLTTYVPQADLGNIRDSVNTFALLPVPFTAMGSTVLASNRVTIISTTGVIQRGDLVLSTSLGLQFATGTTVADVISATEIQITPAALETSTNFSITFTPIEGDLRGVIADGIIYRWSGSAWLPFTRTGTMQHPELLNQNSDTNYQHLTQTQRDNLLITSHSHSNKLVLDNILSAGSGNIITTAERNLLPTTSQKAALVGTSGVPSATNPYITHLDPRLNTTRNPYVTIGPPGSLATFQGVDFRPFEDAILAIDLGSASTVKAIEVLCGTYNLSGVSIIWNTQTSSLLLEGFTPQTATLSFQTRTAGIKATGSGGPLIVRGFTFELNDQGTAGVLSTRENTLIEDCVFKPGPTTSLDQYGITLSGAGSIVRRCKFMGQLTKGVEIKAANCRVESCTFNLTSATNFAVDVFAGADSALIDHNFMVSGTTNIQAGVNFVNVTNNRFYSIANSLIDFGTSTRYLENQPEEVNQPFIGKKRTVGYLGTYADYRGSNETPFIAALADPNVTEIEVLEGTYTFASTVTIPAGKAIRGVWQGDTSRVMIVGAAGVQPFKISNWSRLENLHISGSNTSLITGVTTSISDANLEHCSFNLTTVSATTQYEVSFQAPTDCLIRNCFFTGQRGLKLYGGSTRTRLWSSVFSNSSIALTMDTAITNNKDHIKDNHFITTTAPAIAGSILLVENNHFLGNLPTKLNTISTIWQGNWPHPTANNDKGVDTLDISLDRYLEPSSDGAERSFIASSGTISFVEDQISITSTLPIALQTRLDKTKSYTVKIFWTCQDGMAGAVAWRVTAVFRDNVTHQIGTSVQNASVSTRSSSVATTEDVTTMTFTSYGLATDPTHVSFLVERVGTDSNDTLTVNAHLLEVQVLLPRD
jgi:hypothetical protein